MFKIFKKKESGIVSPAKGIIKDISKVKDETFSSKCLGEGFAIEPSIGEVFSPVDGSIVTVFPTKHAIVIKSADEKEILIHIGVDSVTLNGQGFKSLVKEGQKISAGEKITEFDLELLKNEIPSTDIIVVFTNGNRCNILGEERAVNAGEENIVTID